MIWLESDYIEKIKLGSWNMEMPQRELWKQNRKKKLVTQKSNMSDWS